MSHLIICSSLFIISFPSYSGLKRKLIELGSGNSDAHDILNVTEIVSISDSTDQMKTEESDMATWLAEEPDIDETEEINIANWLAEEPDIDNQNIKQMRQPNVAFAMKPHLNFESGLKGRDKFVMYVC